MITYGDEDFLELRKLITSDRNGLLLVLALEDEIAKRLKWAETDKLRDEMYVRAAQRDKASIQALRNECNDLRVQLLEAQQAPKESEN